MHLQTLNSPQDVVPSSSRIMQLLIQSDKDLENLAQFFSSPHLDIQVDGFLGFDNYAKVFEAANIKQFESFSFKNGYKNHFGHNDAEVLASLIGKQSNLKKLALHFDSNDEMNKEEITIILEAISKVPNLECLELHFEDDVIVDVEALKYIKSLKSLKMAFGSNVIHGNWSALQNSTMESLEVSIQPYNNLNESFNIFLSQLPTSIRELKLEISLFNQLSESAIKSLQFNSRVKTLEILLFDTRNLSQEAFDKLVESIGTLSELEQLNLQLGNNHKLTNFNQLNLMCTKLPLISLNIQVGQGFMNLFTGDFLKSQNKNLRTLYLELNKNSMLKDDSFKGIQELLKQLDFLKIKCHQDFDDSYVTDFISLIDNAKFNAKISLNCGSKGFTLQRQSLQVSLERVESLDSLFASIQNTLKKIQNLSFKIKHIKNNNFDQTKCVKYLQESNLRVFQLTIRKISNYQCQNIIDFFAESIQSRQWYFLSFDVYQQTVLQMYVKSLTNVYVKILVSSNLKLAIQGEESIAKALSKMNVTKLRLMILMENNVSQKGQKAIAAALFNSSNLEKISLQIQESNQSVQQFVGKMQHSLNQYIKDKSKMIKTYCALLTKEQKKNKDNISIEMLEGVSDYLMDDIQQTPSQIQPQYHGQQGFGYAANPQTIIDLFEE